MDYAAPLLCGCTMAIRVYHTLYTTYVPMRHW